MKEYKYVIREQVIIGSADEPNERGWLVWAQQICSSK